MNKGQSIHQLLAMLGAGIVVAGCGGAEAPVNAAEVPAANAPATAHADSPPAAATQAASPPAATPAAAPAAAPTAAPTAAPAAQKAMPSHKEMPRSNRTVKVRDSKRAKPCQAGCGEGTCGDC